MECSLRVYHGQVRAGPVAGNGLAVGPPAAAATFERVSGHRVNHLLIAGPSLRNRFPHRGAVTDPRPAFEPVPLNCVGIRIELHHGYTLSLLELAKSVGKERQRLFFPASRFLSHASIVS